MVLRIVALLALVCAAGCREVLKPSDDLLRGMVGKEVMATELPQEVHVWCGPIPSPDMVKGRDDRRIYYGILVGFDDERITLKPLAHWPKTFHLGPTTFTNQETGEESIYDGPVNYATSLGVWRDRIENVEVVEPAELKIPAQPGTSATDR